MCPFGSLGWPYPSVVLLPAMESRHSCFSDICSIMMMSGDADLDSSDVILDWSVRPRNKPASDRSNEVNCMIFCEAKWRQVCKTLGLRCCFHLSFPKNSITVPKHEPKEYAEQNPFAKIFSWKILWNSSHYLKQLVCYFPWDNWAKEICFFIGVIFPNSRCLYRCTIARAEIFVFQMSF